MADEGARQSLLSGDRTRTPQPADNTGSFYDNQEPNFTTFMVKINSGFKSQHNVNAVPSPKVLHQKLLQLAFVVVVIAMVVISFILSIYRSASVPNGIYILLGLAMVGYLGIEVIMILFIRNGDLAVEKTWFLYAVGASIIVQCIFTNILLFR